MSKPKHDLKGAAYLIIKRLKDRGIGCYLWHGNHKSASHYIRFDEVRMGSIRIADHPALPQYKYRFNVRADIEQEEITENQFFFRLSKKGIGRLIQEVVKRKEVVDRMNTDSTYKYNIPFSKLYPTSTLTPREQLSLDFDETKIQHIQDYTP
jgi:hypothetical protein